MVVVVQLCWEVAWTQGPHPEGTARGHGYKDVHLGQGLHAGQAEGMFVFSPLNDKAVAGGE